MNFPLQLQTISVGAQRIDFFVPDPGAVRSAYEEGKIAFPYWSKLWPAALALAEFLFRFPDYTTGKTVLELGAGLGLPSLVAAQNAASVLCSDAVAEAVRVAAASAAHNGLQNVRAEVIDWNHLPNDTTADVLLLSDVNYEPEAFARLRVVLEQFHASGTQILLCTPQRLMAKDFVADLLVHCIYQEERAVEHEGKNVMTTVMVLEKLSHR